MRVSKGRPIGASAADKVLDKGRNYSDSNWYVRTTNESNGGVALGSLAFLMCRTSFPQVAVIGGMAAFANLGGGGCQCNLTHHHQLIYELILHHLDRPFKRFQGVLGAPAGNRAPLRARSPQRNNARNPHQPARSCFCFYGHVAFSGL